ncbi:MAG TPA: protein kinase [Polyangiaceae bacterium]|nr:protein kinase [Polyangiaceae bacterium]
MDLSDANLPFAPGDVLAEKYRIDRVLGVGGMGVVVAATHLDLDSKVAIKVMRGELLSNESAVKRLVLEARSAAKIRSEHVARVLDVGTLPGGSPYIVMEFLDGCDLGQLLMEQGPLPVSQAVDFLLEACEALAEAHAAQIIHRDLKPENLFVSRRADGSPSIKVVDFGISKQLGMTPGTRALTNPSTAVGSPQYMAPEQMQARPVDARVDIWALGAILYQLVSGKHAFDGETLPEVCAKVLSEDPPLLQSVRADLPKDLEVIVSRCLRKDPQQRFEDVASLALALTPLGTTSAQLSLERITRVIRGAGSVVAITPSMRKNESGSGTAPTIAASTPIASGGTFASTPAQKSSALKWLVPALLALSVGVIAALLLRSPTTDTAQGTPAPVANSPAVVASKAPTATAPAAAPSIVAAPDSIPQPSASTNAIPSANAVAPLAVAPPAVSANQSGKVARPVRKPLPSKNTNESADKAWDPASFGGRR